MAISNPAWVAVQNATIAGNTVTNNNAGSDLCGVNATAPPNSGATSLNGLVIDEDWEFRCQLSGRNPNGRVWLGIVMTDVAFGATPLDYTMWQFCLHVSTVALSTATPPRPANSVVVYEEGEAKAWVDGIWTNTDQQLRMICLGGTVRYYVDCTLIYRSLGRHQYPMEAIIGMACHNTSVINAQIIKGPMVGVGTGAIGAGDAANLNWSIPTPYDMPQPPIVNAPIATRCQEVISNWNEYGTEFADKRGQYNTKLARDIRMFEIEWTGLSIEQAAVLDAHYDLTSGGLPFTFTHPETGERITNCRYASYTLSPHTRVWSQSRSATIIRYTE